MAEDISNQRFGKLIAIRPTGEKRNGQAMWECRCDCGNTVAVRKNALKTGNTQSCGCSRTSAPVKSGAKDLTGQRFGKLVALRPTDKRQGGMIVWECKCDCGNVAFAPSRSLYYGERTSCGCAPAKLDLTGQRFGRLMVLRPTEERKNSRIMWECRCDCGNICFARSSSLKSGHKISCGCLSGNGLQNINASDLTGQRFGKLVALHPTEERKNGFLMWECRCDCGNICFARSSSLKSGHKISCGCLSSRLQNTNANDLTGQRFGRLVALTATEKRWNSQIVWECKCDCGNICFVGSGALRSGNKQSCGCSNSKRGRKASSTSHEE